MVAVLGISAHYHDAAAALVVDGRVVAAMQEERFTRIKNDAALPVHAARACLKRAPSRLVTSTVSAFPSLPQSLSSTLPLPARGDAMTRAAGKPVEFRATAR